jgi:FXSXX-COOH protein
MEETITQRTSESPRHLLADLRTVPLADLAADRDGSIAELRTEILDGQGRLLVAGFQSAL